MNDPSQQEPIVSRSQLDPQDDNYLPSRIREDAGDTRAEEVLQGEAVPEALSITCSCRVLQPQEVREDDRGLNQRRIEPNNPEAFYTISTYYWDKAYRDFRLKEPEKKEYVLKGLEQVDKALQLKPDYMEALTYKNLLLRLQANLEKDQGSRRCSRS
jgi:hypothetical protein